MSIQPVNTPLNPNYNKSNPQKPIAFKGADNFVVTLMDGIDRGGFAASFILQDMLGMAVPRIGAGFTRNSEETGKPNYAFAAKEAIREILSGPSTFVIPMMMLAGIKKAWGSAHDVSAKFINGMGGDFATFAKSQTLDTLKDANVTKAGFYKESFKNLIHNTLGGKLGADDVTKIAEDYSKRLLDIEKAKPKSFFKRFFGKPVAGSADDLTQALIKDFTDLKKAHLGVGESALGAVYKGAKGNLTTNIKKYFSNLKNYTDDAVSKVAKNAKSGKLDDIAKYVENFNFKRIGGRLLVNVGMYATVIAFMTIVPKLYKSKEGNPGLVGLPVEGASKVENKEAVNANKQ